MSSDYPELCFYCPTPSSVTKRGGTRVCQRHAEVTSLSNYVVCLLMGLAVVACLGWFAVASLHGDRDQLLLSAFVGLACAWGSVVAWKESR